MSPATSAVTSAASAQPTLAGTTYGAPPDPLPCQARHFRLARGHHYLNCAYGAPLLRDVERAGRDALARWRVPHALGPESYFVEAERVRALFGRLVGDADGERVAIVPGVAYGVALAARNVPLRGDANVVVAEGQFPSNLLAWRRRCGETGAELRVVARPPAGGWSERILDAIDARTAVVALGSIDWTDGTLFDLEAIGARARAVDAAYVLDGIQSLGALPFDVARVQPDLLATSSYKWLLGPMGVGLCRVGERFADAVPLEETWLGRAGSEDFSRLTEHTDRYQPGARRFDASGRAHFILLPMLAAALRSILAWDPVHVQAYCVRLVAPALDALGALGVELPHHDPQAWHLFAITPPASVTPERLRAALRRRRVHVSQRGGRIRVSPNVYNTPDDLGALVDAIASALRPRRARL